MNIADIGDVVIKLFPITMLAGGLILSHKIRKSDREQCAAARHKAAQIWYAKEVAAAGARLQRRDNLYKDFGAVTEPKPERLIKVAGAFSDEKAQSLITGIFNNREEKIHNEKI